MDASERLMYDGAESERTPETTQVSKASSQSGPEPNAGAAGATPSAEPQARFLRACRGLPVDRLPIWIMRQAGRYLPEYRAIRKQASFLEVCHDPDLACEVTMQPLRRFDLDAAILFSDIMIPVEAMGVKVDFRPGPVIEAPIRTRADVDRLTVPDPRDELDFVCEAVRRIRGALDDGSGAGRSVPLIGFAGAPFTLACYLVDGAGSKTFGQTRGLMQADPATFDALLKKLTDTTSAYLRAQVEAGAQAVQVFDSWVGLLGPEQFRERVAPHLERLFDGLRSAGVPLIYFAFGGATLLPQVRALRPDVAGIDWRVPLSSAREILGDRVALQGNLDPAVLLSDEANIRGRAREVCEAMTGQRGHVFNLGHGIWKETDPAAVAALIDEVHAWEVTEG